MKNLKLYSELCVDVELQSDDESLRFSAFHIEHDLMLFSSTSGVVHALFLNPSQDQNGSKVLRTQRCGVIDLEYGDHVTALEYLMEREVLIAGTSNGFLLLFSVDTCSTEVVGRVDQGIRDISPCPDGALIAIAFGIGQIILMTQDWEVICETTAEVQEHDHISATDDRNDHFNYANETHITWRGDGKYFATLEGPCGSLSLQKVKIWERDSGSVHAVSDSKNFMRVCLDWMPAGAKIAAAYDKKEENKCPSIVFFERNGFERGSFSIEESLEATVEFLNWNSYSDLLGAIVKCDGYDAIKIWSFSNNHWYLKQEIRFSKKDKVNFRWDPKRPLQLICWTSDGKIKSYRFFWKTAVMENSTAVVIDNTRVLMTPLDVSLMPPPMSLFSLHFLTPVQNIAFTSTKSKTCLAVGSSDGSLSIVEFLVLDSWELLEGKKLIVQPCECNEKLGVMLHLVWLDSRRLLCVTRDGEGNAWCLLEIELPCSENSSTGLSSLSGWSGKILKRHMLDQLVISIVQNPMRSGSVFVQFDGGLVCEYSSTIRAENAMEPSLKKVEQELGFLYSCPWMNAVRVNENSISKPMVFGLDDDGRFQVYKRVMCNNCTSFSFYSSSVGIMQQRATHLVFTTKQDSLCVVDINEIVGKKVQEIGNSFFNDSKILEDSDCIAIWEKGAKIVGVIHGDEAAVIMQTNRGNLECIYPRKLVVGSIVDALIQRRFKEAMIMVRRHRIDFNVIVDHCGWCSFIKLAPEFVSEVNNLGHLTDFVCSISNENVMETIYKHIVCVPSLSDFTEISHGTSALVKVTSVLLAIKAAIEEKVDESPSRELCILTTLARCEPPALEEALKRIKAIREKELAGVDEFWRKSYPSAEDAIKHLLWLLDPQAVFDTALRLYDLNLAAIVALNSQKDPKEFVPFLQDLESMPPLFMKYSIDLRLRRYESALRHLFAIGEDYYDDCIDLIKKYPHLFPLGTMLFAGRPQKLQVLELWGDHLFAEKIFEEAATNYLCCSAFHKALKAYQACGNWKKLFLVAGLLKLDREEMLQLAHDLSEELNALGKPADAAQLLIDYCKDVDNGVSFLVIAREWEEALRIGFMYRREDLILKVTDSAVECSNSLISDYEEGMEKVGKYLTRYLAVRQRRLLLKAKLDSEENSMKGFDDDTSSETSSNLSGMSVYTTGTMKGSGVSVSSTTLSKSRRQRQQRKKGGKIRAGSPGEELALVDHLKAMQLTDGAQLELKTLISALVVIGKEEMAIKLQKVASSFQTAQLAAVLLAEDTLANDAINDKIHTLEHYVQKLKREKPKELIFFWQSKVLLPP